MEKVSIIIQARMSSSRFPGKVMVNISDKPQIWHIIERLRYCELADDIIVATTSDPEESELIKYLTKINIKYFQFDGDPNNVLKRYMETALKFNSEIVVRVTGDAPLLHPETIDKMIDKLLKDKDLDYVHINGITVEGGYEALRLRALKRIYKKAVLPAHKEHTSLYITKHPDEFKISSVKGLRFQNDNFQPRLWLDTKADLEFLKTIYDKLYVKESIISLEDVLILLKNNPEMLKINKHVKQKNPYCKCYAILFAVDNEIINQREFLDNINILYCKITENTGCGVRIYFQNNEIVKKMTISAKLILSKKDLQTKLKEFDIVIWFGNKKNLAEIITIIKYKKEIETNSISDEIFTSLMGLLNEKE